MGVSISRQMELSENPLLQRFVGKVPIAAADEAFWTEFLQYQIALPTDSQEQLSLDSRIESLCQSFIAHNLHSGNLGALVSVFLAKVADLLELPDKESTRHVWHAFNALFVIRCLIKYIIETGSEYQLLQHFETVPTVPTATATATTTNGAAAVETQPQQQQVDGSKFESFFDAVVSLIVVIPSKEFTYHLHLEAVNLIVILFSLHQFSGAQQQSTSPASTTASLSGDQLDKSIIFRTIYRNPNANMLMGALLHFVSRMVEQPATMFGQPAGGSYVFGLADTLYSLLTFRKPATVDQVLAVDDLQSAFRQHYPLANQSLLLMLILTNHCSAGANAYRQSLFGCDDAQTASAAAAVAVSTSASAKNAAAAAAVTFRIDFGQLFGTLSHIVHVDQATLLLYLLLHRNQRFYRYVMAQPNVEQLIIPILQTLYNAPDSTSHHIYMSLIVLLMLSEDDGFNKAVHQIQLRNVPWYTERAIAEISLGGLLILVVIRTIQYNMIKMRDKYLHTNCLAALANMSGQFRALHPYVAQRLVSLFETLAKKHARLEQRLKGDKLLVDGAGGEGVPVDPLQTVVVVPEASSASSAIIEMGGDSEDMIQDLSVLEEVLRMVLEILNSCLSHQLVYCPNLVYTLLYKRHVFEAFRSQHAFQDIIQNIDMVVGFFSSRLQRVQDQRGELGVAEVLEVITKGASQWSSDRLRKFPDLKFKYVEEDAPEEFFIPYVWTLVGKYGCVHFSSESMRGVTTEIGC